MSHDHVFLGFAGSIPDFSEFSGPLWLIVYCLGSRGDEVGAQSWSPAERSQTKTTLPAVPHPQEARSQCSACLAFACGEAKAASV